MFCFQAELYRLGILRTRSLEEGRKTKENNLQKRGGYYNFTEKIFLSK